MKRKIPFTHKGWFGLCPIYAADIETDSPRLEPRLPLTGWLIDVSAGIFGLMGSDSFPIMFTGELKPPKVIEVDA